MFQNKRLQITKSWKNLFLDGGLTKEQIRSYKIISKRNWPKNNQQNKNGKNMSEDIPRTKIPRFKQSYKASTRIMKSKPILVRIKPQNLEIKKKFQKLQNKMPLRQFLQNCSQRKWSTKKINKK